jgi:hypothetical protein
MEALKYRMVASSIVDIDGIIAANLMHCTKLSQTTDSLPD